METEKPEAESKPLSIAEVFGEIPEPRVVGRSKHNLVEMLMLAVCAMVCGIDDFVGIEEWGNQQIDWLRGFLKLENGIPSHDTFGRLFGLLDQGALENGFRRWVGHVLPELAKGSVVAVDGKASRRSRQAGKQALHLVSAFATQARLVLGQESVRGKVERTDGHPGTA
jgi:hypothetical protein